MLWPAIPTKIWRPKKNGSPQWKKPLPAPRSAPRSEKAELPVRNRPYALLMKKNLVFELTPSQPVVIADSSVNAAGQYHDGGAPLHNARPASWKK